MILVGFLLFFMIPFEALPFSGAVTAMLLGGLVLAIMAAYTLRLRSKETFDFGHFLVARGGFWMITVTCFALLVFLSGLLICIAPQSVEPAFERGAMPVAAALAVLFWLALIFMFSFLTFQSAAHATALVKIGKIKKALGSAAITAVCLALAALFFSLFVEMINDTFVRLSARFQSFSLIIFSALVVVAGIVDGIARAPGDHLDAEEMKS